MVWYQVYSENNMAAEAPKFSFTTVNDLLDAEDFNYLSRGTSVQAKKKDIYHRMYLELIERDTLKTDTVEDEKTTSGGCVCDKDQDVIQPHSTKDKEECIWNNEELRTLRKCFQRLKLHNIALVGQVDSLQKELLDCKQNEKRNNVTLTTLKEKWAELKKRYKRIKISCKSMKEDLAMYHSSLKSAGEEIHNLQNERTLFLKDLKALKTTLGRETLRNRDLETRLQEKDREKIEALRHCEFITRQQCKLDETLLKKEIFLLKEELKKEKQENRINKNALENLRKHFASVQLNDQNCLGLDNVLNTEEIDFN